MRRTLTLLVTVVTLVACQSSHYQQSAQQAAILSDARYLAGDGTFGAAYSQEDGVEFKEESDVNGDRRGSYSYVDPTGQRRTVTYTAGKNGFQATGDHIPTAPSPAPPQPEYVPLPQYNPPDYRPPSYAPQIQRQYEELQSAYQPQPDYQSAYQRPQTQPAYQPQPQPAYQPQPQPAYQPQPQPAYQQPQPQSHYQYQPRSQYQLPSELNTIPSYTARGGQYQPEPRPAPTYNAITTPAPHRFYPPGKLSFNRTPDGYSYTFSKS